VNGVFARDRCQLMADAHRLLGASRVMIVHGEGGLDEFAPAGATFVAELKDGHVRTYDVWPRDFGLDEADPAGLRGGEPALNARVLTEALNGAGGAVRTVGIMTAAAALYVAGQADDLSAGARRAAAALDDGSALRVMERLRVLAPRQAEG
jgi:anthranilate phosphoribosyltransferase